MKPMVLAMLTCRPATSSNTYSPKSTTAEKPPVTRKRHTWVLRLRDVVGAAVSATRAAYVPGARRQKGGGLASYRARLIARCHSTRAAGSSAREGRRGGLAIPRPGFVGVGAAGRSSPAVGAASCG